MSVCDQLNNFLPKKLIDIQTNRYVYAWVKYLCLLKYALKSLTKIVINDDV